LSANIIIVSKVIYNALSGTSNLTQPPIPIGVDSLFNETLCHTLLSITIITEPYPSCVQHLNSAADLVLSRMQVSRQILSVISEAILCLVMCCCPCIVKQVQQNWITYGAIRG